jgi:hypothetical protein
MGGIGLDEATLAAGCAIALAVCFQARPCQADPDSSADRDIGKIEVIRHPAARACPDAVTLGALVAEASGQDNADVQSDARRLVQFNIEFDRNDAGFVATVRVSGALHGERTLTSSEATCATLATSLAVTLTILLDWAKVPVETPAWREEGPAAPGEHTAAATPPGTTTSFEDVPKPQAEDGPPPPIGRNELAPNTRRTASTLILLEAGGPAFFYSLNYERFFDDDVSLRIGFGYVPGPRLPSDSTSPWAASVPLVASYHLGTASHKLQLGAGVTLLYLSKAMSSDLASPEIEALAPRGGLRVVGSVVVGYRFIPKDGGPSVGVAVTPLFDSAGFSPWVAINAGWAL